MTKTGKLSLLEWNQDYAKVEADPRLSASDMSTLPFPYPEDSSYKGRTQTLTFKAERFRSDPEQFNLHLQKIAEQVGYIIIPAATSAD